MLETIHWHTKRFEELSINELYDILKLRIDVFVVEQECFYPDLDDSDRDPNTLHCFAYTPSANGINTLIAYSRILPKGISYADFISIGRVVTSPLYRRYKLGYSLMEYTLCHCQNTHANQPIKLSAQAHLQKFYEHFNFIKHSDVYLEDNIPHIAMLKI